MTLTMIKNKGHTCAHSSFTKPGLLGHQNPNVWTLFFNFYLSNIFLFDLNLD